MNLRFICLDTPGLRFDEMGPGWRDFLGDLEVFVSPALFFTGFIRSPNSGEGVFFSVTCQLALNRRLSWKEVKLAYPYNIIICTQLTESTQTSWNRFRARRNFNCVLV